MTRIGYHKLIMSEVWKHVPLFPNYMVSSLGRLKSVKREVPWAHHGVNGMAEKKEKILKPIPRKLSKYITYIQHTVKDERGKMRSVHVHRFVAQAFVPNPENKPQVNHIDGDGTNNHFSNLEWVTISENSLHAYHILNRKPSAKGRFGILSNRYKRVKQIALDGTVVRVWDSMMDAHREGYDSGSICHTCKGRKKTYKGFKWEYV